MTRDDITRMAKEAGLAPASFCRWSAYSDDLERFATLVAAHEREACAKAVESRKTGANELMDAVRDMEAAAIRARGEENKS